jgi:hypothetical protein
MSKIIKTRPGSEYDGKRTLDSIHYKKDCPDFVCLEDGTIVRECRYCNLSLICRQVDMVDGQAVPMEAHRLPMVDAEGNVVAEELFCTGMHDIRPLVERSEDDKVS